MARSKYLVEREKISSKENQETLLRKRRLQGCVPGLCTVTCEVTHDPEERQIHAERVEKRLSGPKALVLIGAALLMSMTACGNSSSSTASSGPDLDQAYSLCVSHADPGVKGRIKHPSPDEIQILGAADGNDMAALGCLFKQLDTPDTMIADLGVATAQSGSDSRDAGGLHYAWSIQVDGMVTSYPALHMSITKS